MKIAFVHGHIALGGIETLMLKLSRAFAAAGDEVTIIAGRSENDDLERQLREAATVCFHPMSFIRGYPRWRARRTLPLHDVDILLSMGAPQLLMASVLSSRAPRARIVTGVYSPWEYFPTQPVLRHDWRLSERHFDALPDTNVIFMNEACRTEHRNAWQRSFDASPVIPLPVDVAPLPRNRAVIRNKIVSIGRIVEFKPYHFHMIAILRELSARGIYCEYHVHGDGAALPRLRAEIARSPVRDQIHLHGPVDYSAIPAVLSDAWMFIGVGTAALDAAALGVPTVVAYESQTPLSLGFFHETAEGEFGDTLSRGTRYPLLDKIVELATASLEGRARIARAGLRVAERYGTPRIAARYRDAFAAASRVALGANVADFARASAGAALSKVAGLFGRTNPAADRYVKRLAPPARATTPSA